MTAEEVKAMIDSMGFPNTYDFFPIGEVPTPPYIVFYYPSSSNFGADDEVYQRIDALNIELYTPIKSFRAEKAVEDVLTANHMMWDKTETYINSEHMYEVLYEMEIVVNG